MNASTPDFLDGVLPSDQVQAFEAHMASCANCRAHHDQLVVTLSLLGQLPAPTPEAPEAVMALFDAWSAERQEATPPPLWVLARESRHWQPALKISLFTVPVIMVLNHAMCFWHMQMGLQCLVQTLAVATLPFAVALYASARAERFAEPWNR